MSRNPPMVTTSIQNATGPHFCKRVMILLLVRFAVADVLARMIAQSADVPATEDGQHWVDETSQSQEHENLTILVHGLLRQEVEQDASAGAERDGDDQQADFEQQARRLLPLQHSDSPSVEMPA